MIWSGLKKALGLDPNDRALKKYEALAEEINALSAQMGARSTALATTASMI